MAPKMPAVDNPNCPQPWTGLAPRISCMCRQDSHWFPLRCNQLAGVRWRGRLLGPGRAVAELRTP